MRKMSEFPLSEASQHFGVILDASFEAARQKTELSSETPELAPSAGDVTGYDDAEPV